MARGVAGHGEDERFATPAPILAPACLPSPSRTLPRIPVRCAVKWILSQLVPAHAGGEPHGQSVLAFPSGERYEGTFRNGMFHGPGVYTHPDGRRLAGEFRNNVFQAQGDEADVDLSV